MPYENVYINPADNPRKQDDQATVDRWKCDDGTAVRRILKQIGGNPRTDQLLACCRLPVPNQIKTTVKGLQNGTLKFGSNSTMATPAPTLTDLGSKTDAIGAQVNALTGDISQALAKITAIGNTVVESNSQDKPTATPKSTWIIAGAAVLVLVFFFFMKKR